MGISLDVESFKNYFLIVLKSMKSGNFVCFEIKDCNSCFTIDNIKKIYNLLKNFESFGFNSNHYDIPIIIESLKGRTCLELNKISDAIISNDFKKDSKKVITKHFDLFKLTSVIKSGLKTYGARLHTKIIKDLPYKNKLLTDTEKDEIKNYCKNDVNITAELYEKIKNSVDLRRDIATTYNFDYYSTLSLADSTIGENILLKYIKPNNENVHNQFKYKAPACIEFKTQDLIDFKNYLENYNFYINKATNKINYPVKDTVSVISINNNSYKVGLGGLHSKEENKVYRSGDKILMEADVTSYYPNIILNNNYYPEMLGSAFIKVYNNLVYERQEAKKNNNRKKSDLLKIAINSIFGKLNNHYSKIYSPKTFYHITLTGQLTLLWLIEKLELAGIDVVSANTDGVVAYFDKKLESKYYDIVKDWQDVTKYNLEFSNMKSLYIKNVNNYLAFTNKGDCKRKGSFVQNSLMKNPNCNIIYDCIENFLEYGKSIKDTILECKDVRKFLMMRTVQSGVINSEKTILYGKTVRWIHSKIGEPLYDAKKHHLVNNTTHAQLLQTLPDNYSIPKSINYQIYIDEANKYLQNFHTKIF